MSSQWRALPASLDPETAYLVDALRDLKDRSGLSLAALGTATPYSKSSWERYLNGRILPPRHAVESLAEVTGQPAGRLLALWQLAEVRCSGRDQTQAPAVDGPVAPAIVDPAPAGRDVRVPAWLGIAAAVAIGILVVVLTKPFGFLRDSAPAAPGYSVGCHGAQCAGREPEAWPARSTPSRPGSCASRAPTSSCGSVGGAERPGPGSRIRRSETRCRFPTRTGERSRPRSPAARPPGSSSPRGWCRWSDRDESEPACSAAGRGFAAPRPSAAADEPGVPR
jgi:transcriptional regulator with XRE-family HTH domain